MKSSRWALGAQPVSLPLSQEIQTSVILTARQWIWHQCDTLHCLSPHHSDSETKLSLRAVGTQGSSGWFG